MIAQAHPCSHFLVGIDTDPEHAVILAFGEVAQDADRPRDMSENTQMSLDLIDAGEPDHGSDAFLGISALRTPRRRLCPT